MDTIVAQYLSKLEFGELQQFKKLAVVPLFTSIDHSPEYLTLKEALEKKILIVKEVSHGGSVPELEVTNKAEVPVLLLDGEELAGAKQNRVLNTTILLKEHSDTVIPVSCTEQGRWSSVSEEFADSKVVASPSMRAVKASSVTESLNCSGEFKSNQADIWCGIDEMSACAGVESPTSAMKDVYKSSRNKLNEYLKAFKHVPCQRGLLVFINGEIAGFDIVSLESAYETLHAKLVKSYAMDALLQRGKKAIEPSIDKAKAFVEEATACEEKRYESIGHGWDYRFQGKAIIGSAPVYRKKVIHAAFFKTGESDKAGPVSEYRRRKGFRI